MENKMAIEKTFSIIKPNAMKKMQSVQSLQSLKAKGLKLQPQN